MPMPPGTYQRIQAGAKTPAVAADAKKTVALARADAQSRFFEALDRVAEGRLATWHRQMDTLAAAIRKNEPLSREDKVRKAVAEVLGEVKKLLVRAKDLQALDATLKRPAEVVVRAPVSLPGAELTLVIALVQVLAVLVRLRKRRR